MENFRTRKQVMVGGPYSGNTPEEIERNIVAAERLGFEVAAAGAACVVPNSMGRSYQGVPSYEEFMEVTISILANSDALIVTSDWERSSGTRREVEYAQENNIPVLFSIPELRDWLAATRDDVWPTPIEIKRMQHEIKLLRKVSRAASRLSARGMKHEDVAPLNEALDGLEDWVMRGEIV